MKKKDEMLIIPFTFFVVGVFALFDAIEVGLTVIAFAVLILLFFNSIKPIKNVLKKKNDIKG